VVCTRINPFCCARRMTANTMAISIETRKEEGESYSALSNRRRARARRRMMPWFSGAVRSQVLTVIIRAGAAVITQDTVSCVSGSCGPYHLELVVGAGCNSFVPGLTAPNSPGSGQRTAGQKKAKTLGWLRTPES
jgi:hypothetical protein